MKLKSKWPVRRFFAFLGALYLFCAVTPLLFAGSGTAKSESGFRIYDTATETVHTVNDLEFLCGALPCEINGVIPAVKGDRLHINVHRDYINVPHPHISGSVHNGLHRGRKQHT